MDFLLLGLFLLLLFGVLFFLAAWLIIRRRKKIQIAKLKDQHRQIFEDFIRDLNHNGAIPLSASAKGMLGVVTGRFIVIYKRLEQKRENQHWDTQEEILELKEILTQEYALAYKTLDDALIGIRTTLKNYDNQQYPQ